MMDISEIKQYTHKIIKIKLTNNNTITTYEYVTIKIHLTKEQNETIRFSIEENSNWIEHQSYEDDYFLRIPNITPSVSYIYAHYFPADLYTYEEDTQIFSIYDFSDFFKEHPTDQWYNEEYPLQITSYGYEMMLGDENKPYIRSLLNKSVTQYKDPNYKQYIIDDNVNDISHMTEQGRFPLSSRYRNSYYRIAPEFNQGNLPYWKRGQKEYSYGTSPDITTTTYENDTYKYNNTADASSNYTQQYGESNTPCTQRYYQTPFWEAKIHRKGLSPLITETYSDDYASEDKDAPFNVFLNYQYLPTSTEYHQHYYGFEGHNVRDASGNLISRRDNLPEAIRVLNDPEATQANQNKLAIYCENLRNGTYRQLTQNKNFEILDGEGLHYINNQFGKSATYRLINHGNPFDDKYIMTTDHTNVIDLNLDDAKILKNCTWERNQCDKYWTLTPLANDGEDSLVYLDVTLKAHTPYVLKYYIYIPADAYIEDSQTLANYNTLTPEQEIAADTCFISVQTNVNNNKQTIGTLQKEFRHQDKNLRHQWVYHEIPFYTLEANNRVVIKGPKHSVNDIYTYNNQTGQITLKDDETFTNEEINSPTLELRDCKNDVIHFYSIQIAEMVEYTPTIKYTNTGLYIVEKDQYARKPLKDVSNTNCIQTLGPYPEWESDKKMPIPFSDVYISFDGDFEILYNELTSEISWTKGDFPFKFRDYNTTFDTTLGWERTSNDIKLQYEELLDNLTENEYNNKKNTDYIGDEYHSIDRDNDTNPYHKNQGHWSLYRHNLTTFTNGINNQFTLKLQDTYGNAITSGTIECAIFTEKDEKAECADAIKCLGEKTPDEYGKIEYKNLNFRGFKPSGEYQDTITMLNDDGEEVTQTVTKQREYWLRIKYVHKCYKKTIIKWKKLIFIQEHANMVIYANRCFDDTTGYNNKVCNSIRDIDNQNNCCKYCTSSYYSTDIGEYQSQYIIKNNSSITVNGPKQYSINSVDELPLRLDVMIRSEPTNGQPEGNILNEGYCELSIDDRIIQTTYVDANGIADFYLDDNDLNKGIQVVKIEYFKQRNYETTNYAYFIINCTNTYDDRPHVPIILRPIYHQVYDDYIEQLNHNVYYIDNQDDLLLIDIESIDAQNFSITIQKEDNETGIYETTDVYNVYDNLETDIIAIEKTDDDNITRYKIITDNLKDDNGNNMNNQYRRYEKTITVHWGRPHQNEYLATL